jgi:hypothetical protein
MRVIDTDAPSRSTSKAPTVDTTRTTRLLANENTHSTRSPLIPCNFRTLLASDLRPRSSDSRSLISQCLKYTSFSTAPLSCYLWSSSPLSSYKLVIRIYSSVSRIYHFFRAVMSYTYSTPSLSPSNESSNQGPAQADRHDSEPLNVNKGPFNSVDLGLQTAAGEFLDWESPEDPQNPFNWRPFRKWTITILACFMTFVVQVNGTAMTSAWEHINNSFNVSDRHFPHSYWPVLSWNLGGAAAPMLALPLMENFGIRWSYLVSKPHNVSFQGGLLTSLLGCLSRSYNLPRSTSSGHEFCNSDSYSHHHGRLFRYTRKHH